MILIWWKWCECGWFVFFGELINSLDDEGQLCTYAEANTDLIDWMVFYTQRWPSLLLAVTVSNFVTIVFHSHFPTTQISGSRRPPFTFSICLSHFPNFSLGFRLGLLSVIRGSLIFQTQIVFCTFQTWRRLQRASWLRAESHVRRAHSSEELKYSSKAVLLQGLSPRATVERQKRVLLPHLR